MGDMDVATMKRLIAEGPKSYLDLDDVNNAACCNKVAYIATSHLLNASAGSSGYVVLTRTSERGQSSFVVHATAEKTLRFPWGELFF